MTERGSEQRIQGENPHGIYEAALEAHRWNSWTPEKRAAQCVAEVEAHFVDVEQQLSAVGAESADVAREMEEYREGYLRRYRTWLAARGRTASAAVTGPAGFPSRRNRQRVDSERRRSEELDAWSRKAVRAARQRLTPERDPAAELHALEAQLEAMKAANRIIRRKLSDEEKVAAMVTELGWREETARAALEPDFAGRVGFPAHTLASVRGKIKRLRAQGAA